MVEEIGALARNDKVNGAIKDMHLEVGEMQQLLVGIWKEFVSKKSSDNVRRRALQWLGQAVRMNIDKHKSHIDHDRVSSKGLLMVRSGRFFYIFFFLITSIAHTLLCASWRLCCRMCRLCCCNSRLLSRR